MPRLWKAVIVAAAAALGVPAAAQADFRTNITGWTSNTSGTPANDPYLISYDNQQTKLAVAGTAPGAAGKSVNIVCYYGSSTPLTLTNNLLVSASGTFATPTGTSAPSLRPLVGHACRLRAVPSDVSAGDTSTHTGPEIAVSEVALLPTISGGINDGKPYNYYVNGTTFTGFAAWNAPGKPADRPAGTGACGGPYAAPLDQAFGIDNSYPLNCAGSLLADDLHIWGGRSEVQIDGHNAYDAAAAQGLFPRTSQHNGSEDLQGFPSLRADVQWDPSNGLISSRAQESYVNCHASDLFPPTAASCLSFDDTGVELTRVITTSDGGRVITLTDTWSSTDGQSHSLDLLYDDYAGVSGNADSQRGWKFPGQSTFTQYTSGTSVPAPTSVPGSILVHTNVTAADGDPNEGFGAITYGSAPSGLRFASGSELEEHRLLSVPAGGSVSLSYVYSIGYSLADVSALALAAQDRFQPALVRITSPANGTTVTTPYVNLAGTAIAGSGIKSFVVGGQAVPVGSNGVWTSQVPLNPGANTITALATDGAGATSQAQLTVVYQPPSAPGPPPPVAKCKVPRVKGTKLRAAEKALRRAHCKVGKVKHVSSHKTGRGRVMSTTPRAGRKLRAGSKVELVVSKGR